jgi:thiamine-phosphate pyrophosphorylase
MYKENQEYCENVIAVSNRHLCKRPFLEQIKIVCEWHPKALILREKDLTEAMTSAWGREEKTIDVD